MTPDSELLARFAQNRCEEAFAELVRRHLDLVYSAALRQVGGDSHLAQDVTQSVFSDLARKASAISGPKILSGWLYTSARFAAAKIVRTEQRRRLREHAFMSQPTDSSTGPDWEKLRPELDDAMHQLKQTDREAILLRYFENRNYAEIGEHYGLNENAARMRVDRALEKLRLNFLRRGITTTAALGIVISAGAIQLAPPALAATLTTASIAASAGGTLTFWTIMNATKLKISLGALVLIGASTALVVQHNAIQTLRAEQLEWRQLAQPRAAADNPRGFAPNQTNATMGQSISGDQLADLLRLRSEVGKLRRENRQLHEQLANGDQSSNTLAVEDRFKLHQLHVSDAMTTLSTAMKRYADEHEGQYPRNIDEVMTSEVLRQAKFPNDFDLGRVQFMPAGITNQEGNPVLLRTQLSLARPEDGLNIWVYAIGGKVPGTETTAALYGPTN